VEYERGVSDGSGEEGIDCGLPDSHPGDALMCLLVIYFGCSVVLLVAVMSR
jgi:hypothetical protein